MNENLPPNGDDSPVAALLERARSGDQNARNELFERCRPYVSLVARAQVESWLQAKVDHSDLVQQTLL
jgi:DNA-directed RNA polymerase specialized sigma24 family protein